MSIKTGKKILFAAVAVILLGLDLSCLQISGSIDSSEVYLGESFDLTVRVSSNQDVQLPSPSAPRSDGGFKIVDSRTMTSLNIINNNMTKIQETTYEMIPSKEGSFVIYPGSINDGSGLKEALPIKIKVSRQPENRKNAGPEPFFAESELSSSEPYVGQQISYIFRMFIQEDHVRRISSLDLTAPEFTGFWKEQGKERKYTTVMSGKRYLVYEVPTVLFPTRSGVYNIEPSTISFVYSEPVGGRRGRQQNFFGNSVFDDPFFSGMQYKRTRKSLETKKAEMKVKELPSGISLPVGEFKIGFRVNKQRIQQFDAITAVIVLEGDGNINDFTEPFIELPEGFKKFVSKSEVAKNITGARLYGSKTFEFAIVPEKMGEFKLGPVTFKYFDPRTGKVNETKSQEYVIKVEKGDNQIITRNIANGSEMGSSELEKTHSGEDVKLKTAEIRAIKGNQSNLKIQSEAGDELDSLYMHLGLWFCFPVIGFLYSKEVFKLNRNEKLAAVKKSLKIAMDELKPLDTGKKDDFKAMYTIIQKFLNSRFGISASDFTAGMIVKTLGSIGVGSEDASRMADIIQEINYYSLSGISEKKEFNEFKSRVEEILKTLYSYKNVNEKAY